MIDVQRGELKLRVQDDEVKFNVFEAVRHLAKSDTCFMIETIEAIVSSQSGPTDPLETSLVQSESEELGEEVKEYVKWMDSFQPNRRKYYEPLGEIAQTSVPSFKQPPKMERKATTQPFEVCLSWGRLHLTSDYFSIPDSRRRR